MLRGAHGRYVVTVIELARCAVGECLSRAIELGDADTEWLVVAHGPVIEHADPHLLAQQNRSAAGATEVDAGMDAVANVMLNASFKSSPLTVRLAASAPV